MNTNAMTGGYPYTQVPYLPDNMPQITKAREAAGKIIESLFVYFQSNMISFQQLQHLETLCLAAKTNEEIESIRNRIDLIVGEKTIEQ